ncbi:MAG: hypothetical protein BV456_09170 [Thermoplasmata archaeon M8B2D]|nr:MAG: hypothetical protein BV456_09170 [Thermoplasmata archaeon M8B2D]
MADDPDAYIQKGYTGNTSVYSIIDRIDKMRKQAYLKLYKRLPDGSKDEITNHELLTYIEKVNKDTFTDDFITAHLIYLLTIGEFFVYKPSVKTGINKGKVVEIFELPSSDIEIIEGTIFNPVKGYRIEGNNNIMFESNEVYHSKLFNPNAHDERSLHGLSPLRAAAKTVSKLNQIEITELKQFENQSPPYFLFKEIANSGNAIDANANRLTDPQRAEIIKEIKKSANSNTRGLPLILKDKMGKLDLGSNLVDMSTIESSSQGIIALCALYGFPPELLGYGQKTYNNMATARKSAWTDCIMPNLDRVCQTFNACLIHGIPEYKDLRFEFDYSDVEELQEGIKEKVDWMVKSRWTGNEIRIATGKSPIKDDLMDEPIIPMGDSFLSDYSGNDLIDQGNKSFDDYK